METTYTPQQTAKILQVNEQTVRRWLRNGEMTGANTPAGWRLTQDDIQAWLDKHRNQESTRS